MSSSGEDANPTCWGECGDRSEFSEPVDESCDLSEQSEISDSLEVVPPPLALCDSFDPRATCIGCRSLAQPREIMASPTGKKNGISARERINDV